MFDALHAMIVGVVAGTTVALVVCITLKVEDIEDQLKEARRDIATIGCNYKFELMGVSKGTWYEYDEVRNTWKPSTNVVRVIDIKEVIQNER